MSSPVTSRHFEIRTYTADMQAKITRTTTQPEWIVVTKSPSGTADRWVADLRHLQGKMYYSVWYVSNADSVEQCIVSGAYVSTEEEKVRDAMAAWPVPAKE